MKWNEKYLCLCEFVRALMIEVSADKFCRDDDNRISKHQTQDKSMLKQSPDYSVMEMKQRWNVRAMARAHNYAMKKLSAPTLIANI